MNTLALNTGNPNNIYWNLLKNLNDEVKLDLICRLSASLMASNEKKESSVSNWAVRLSGRWNDRRDTAEIIDDIRSSRTSNREIEL